MPVPAKPTVAKPEDSKVKEQQKKWLAERRKEQAKRVGALKDAANKANAEIDENDQ